MPKSWVSLVVAFLAATWVPAALGATAGEKCEATKLKTAGRYGACRLKAEAKAAKKGGAPDVSKCDATFAMKWAKAEAKGGGLCSTDGDEGAMQAFIAEQTDALATALAAAAALPNCDGDLAVCLAQPTGRRLRTGQEVCYDALGTVIACAGTGQDGELQTGLAPSFTDNGDGTITDHRTGLMWEKHSADGSIHDKEHTLNWINAFTKIATLNSTAFAGYSDWRAPNIAELRSLVHFGTSSPSVHAVFHTACAPGCTVLTCSCTDTVFSSWSSTSHPLFPEHAWILVTDTGQVVYGLKFLPQQIRAVRGGA